MTIILITNIGKDVENLEPLYIVGENLKWSGYYGKQLWWLLRWTESFPGGSDGKASACNAGDPASIPWLGRSPGEGNGNPLQYSCLENPMDGIAW